MKTWMNVVVVTVSLLGAAALAQDDEGAMRPGPHRSPMPPGAAALGGGPGIPPQVARKLNIAPATLRQIRELTFAANEQLITLEAELKRAHLELERSLSRPAVEEADVMTRLEAVGRAELGVRKNRMGLMVKVRKLLGPDTWEKLEAEMGAAPGGPGGLPPEGMPPRGPRPDAP